LSRLSFYTFKPFSYIFSEVEASEHPKELWNIWQLDVEKAPADHKFRLHVSIDYDAEEIERFMASTQSDPNAGSELP